jgi:hypothetical protein
MPAAQDPISEVGSAVRQGIKEGKDLMLLDAFVQSNQHLMDLPIPTEDVASYNYRLMRLAQLQEHEQAQQQAAEEDYAEQVFGPGQEALVNDLAGLSRLEGQDEATIEQGLSEVLESAGIFDPDQQDAVAQATAEFIDEGHEPDVAFALALQMQEAFDDFEGDYLQE